jgi:hypothetical protein
VEGTGKSQAQYRAEAVAFSESVVSDPTASLADRLQAQRRIEELLQPPFPR